jgi:hypothetical protein
MISVFIKCRILLCQKMSRWQLNVYRIRQLVMHSFFDKFFYIPIISSLSANLRDPNFCKNLCQKKILEKSIKQTFKPSRVGQPPLPMAAVTMAGVWKSWKLAIGVSSEDGIVERNNFKSPFKEQRDPLCLLFTNNKNLLKIMSPLKCYHSTKSAVQENKVAIIQPSI